MDKNQFLINLIGRRVAFLTLGCKVNQYETNRNDTKISK